MKRIFYLIIFWGVICLSANANNFPTEIDSLINLARKARANDQPLIASGFYEKARRQLKESSSPIVSPPDQFSFFNEALSLVDENLPLARTKQERQSYLRTEYPFLEDGLAICQKLYSETSDYQYFRKAFEIIEKSKSLINYFQNADFKKTFQLENVPDELIAKKAKLNSSLLSLQDSIRNNKNGFQQKRYQNLKNELGNLNKKIQKIYPNYFQFSEWNEMESADKLSEVLNTNEAILEYFFGKESVYLLAMTAEKKTILKLANTQKSNEVLTNFLKNLREPAHYKNMVQTGNQVYKIFIEPAFDYIKDSEKITIIPDGLLGAIPMEAAIKSLPEKLNYDFKKLDYLIHHFQFSYNNSATQFIRQRQNSKIIKDPKIVAFAPVFDKAYHQNFNQLPAYSNDAHYLNATKDSLVILSQNLDWLASDFSGIIYKNKQATLTNFKEHFDADILHFGTHVLFDSKFPMQSKIVLAKEINANNQLTSGYLTLEELQTFQLRGNLAILAGCESGRGKFRRASGINSLAYGFNLAGIPATFYSLWKVNEKESATLIPLFYENLRKNLPKDEALHQAKITYLKNAKDFKAAPAFWAAFVVNGDVSSFEFSGCFWWGWWIVFGVGSFVILSLRKNLHHRKRQILSLRSE